LKFINNKLLNEKNFLKEFSTFKKDIKNKNDLEDILMNNYKKYLKDICEPGTFEINLYETFLFVEAMGDTKKKFSIVRKKK
jgi:hypothetical protein